MSADLEWDATISAFEVDERGININWACVRCYNQLLQSYKSKIMKQYN